MRNTIYLGLVFLLIHLFGCGDSPAASKTITTGNWSGFYMDTIPVSFTVNSGSSSMTNVLVAVNYELSSSKDTTVTWVFDTDINDNSFLYESINGSTTYTFSLAFEGSFTPPNQVNGTILTSAIFDSTGVTMSDTLDGSWSALPE